MKRVYIIDLYSFVTYCARVKVRTGHRWRKYKGHFRGAAGVREAACSPPGENRTTAKCLLSKRKSQRAMKDILDHVSTMQGCSRSVHVNQLSVESFRTAFNCKPTPLLVRNLAQTVYNTIYRYTVNMFQAAALCPSQGNVQRNLYVSTRIVPKKKRLTCI